MKLSELRQDATVKRWLNNLKPKRNTELAYLQALSAYTGYYNVTPYELIDEADKEEINQVRIRDRKTNSVRGSYCCRFRLGTGE